MHEKFFEIARSNMVKNQILPHNVKDRELIDAFLETKKELFVPKKDFDLVYSDSDIFINNERNIIRTFVIAKMLDKCNIKKNNTILVIGCLTGYTLAIISKLVNYVFGVDNDKNLTQIANDNINNLNILNCSVFYKKDLSTGLDKNAPYDKIFIEGSVEKVPDNLLKQLKDDGEIFTVIKKKEDNYVGEFVRGLKVDSGISIEKFFNTNVNELKDFIIWDYEYENIFYKFSFIYN